MFLTATSFTWALGACAALVLVIGLAHAVAGFCTEAVKKGV